MRILYPLFAVTALHCSVFAQQSDQALQAEHVYGGLPSNGHILVRTAYVQDWDAAHKAPKWVAYHLNDEYRRTPPRENRWSTYRADREIQGEARASDYSGTSSDPIRDYEKGHLAPFMISGGDRDNDGLLADEDRDGDGEDQVDDQDEKNTVYQVNFYTNLTPQHGTAFNGSGGVWWDIENRVRALQEENGDVWVFAGPIWGPGEYDNIGSNLPVAPMFYQIIVWEDDTGDPLWEAYMMPHHQENHGDIKEQMVSIRHIEAMTGLDFFGALSLGDAERVSTYGDN